MSTFNFDEDWWDAVNAANDDDDDLNDYANNYKAYEGEDDFVVDIDSL